MVEIDLFRQQEPKEARGSFAREPDAVDQNDGGKKRRKKRKPISH